MKAQAWPLSLAADGRRARAPSPSATQSSSRSGCLTCGTVAIRWLRQGGDIYHLSLHLGHSSLKTTEGYLGYLSAREQAIARHRGGAQTGAQ